MDFVNRDDITNYKNKFNAIKKDYDQFIGDNQSVLRVLETEINHLTTSPYVAQYKRNQQLIQWINSAIYHIEKANKIILKQLSNHRSSLRAFERGKQPFPGAFSHGVIKFDLEFPESVMSELRFTARHAIGKTMDRFTELDKRVSSLSSNSPSSLEKTPVNNPFLESVQVALKVTTLDYLDAYRRQTKLCDKALSDIKHAFKGANSKINKIEALSRKLTAWSARGASKQTGLNKELLLSVGNATKIAIQTQKNNIEILNNHYSNVINALNISRDDNAYLTMGSAELQNYIDSLNELKNNNYISNKLNELKETNVAIHDFMDNATKAYIKKFHREVNSVYSLLKAQQDQLANISEQYLSSRLALLTAYRDDQKMVESKLISSSSQLLSEQISSFEKAPEAVSCFTYATKDNREGASAALKFCMGKTAFCGHGTC